MVLKICQLAKDITMDVNISGIVFIFLFAGMVVNTEQARIKRCFVCRSRGDLGDCKDPFVYNATTAELSRAVEAQPCAAGWCAKVIEGKGDDYAIATERMCLQRPPGDEEQRCSPTLYLNRKVMMCFCKGDLCNTSSIPSISRIGLIVSLLGYLFGKHWL